MNVNACLRIAPSHLKHVTLAFLPSDDPTMAFIVQAPSSNWALQEILTEDKFPGLESVRIVVDPSQDQHPTRVGEVVDYKSLAPRWQDALKDRFKSDFRKKLRFE